MSSTTQIAVFEQLEPTPAADLSEKKQTTGAVAAPLDGGEESQPLEDEQRSCRTTSIFAVAGCVSPRDNPHWQDINLTQD